MVTDALGRRAAPRAGTLAVGTAGTAVFLTLLVGLSLLLRTRAIDAGFWIDEGLSVGIASYPFTEIPGVLVQDGSPPLYYLVLHVWMDAFGRSEAATHALSLLFALLAVPASLWAGWSLFGRRAGWIAAAFAAINPFLTVYAQETRMYSLVILLSILATATFLHAFAYRRRRYLPAFALSLVAMLYTHNWALFFIVGSLLALVAIARENAERRSLVRDAALAYGAALLAFAPWVPTLVRQALHTGAPWSTPPSPLELTGGFMVVLAGQGALVALILAGGTGGARILRGRATPERTAVLAAIVLGVATLLSAWVFSQFTPAWANRYLGVLVGPVLLLAAATLPRAARLGVAALVLVCVFWVTFLASDGKSNVDTVASLYGSSARPGDVVLSTQPEQVPVLAYYLGYDRRYATPLGEVDDPRVMDWRDVLGKLEDSTPEKTLAPLLADLPVGGRVLLVRPLVRSKNAWSAPWTDLVRRRSEEWELALASDDRFRRTDEYEPPYTEQVQRALVVELFEKTSTG